MRLPGCSIGKTQVLNKLVSVGRTIPIFLYAYSKIRNDNRKYATWHEHSAELKQDVIERFGPKMLEEVSCVNRFDTVSRDRESRPDVMERHAGPARAEDTSRRQTDEEGGCTIETYPILVTGFDWAGTDVQEASAERPSVP